MTGREMAVMLWLVVAWVLIGNTVEALSTGYDTALRWVFEVLILAAVAHLLWHLTRMLLKPYRRLPYYTRADMADAWHMAQMNAVMQLRLVGHYQAAYDLNAENNPYKEKP